ncbi:MAG: hypothetical protein WCJ45_07825 [bacterium]
MIVEPSKEKEKSKEERNTEDTIIEPTQPQNVFALPDSAQKINELITIIQTHSGDQEITISGKVFLLNQEGIQKIHDLFIK